MQEREHWKSRSIFIMAAVGSAVGLGNIWRFPYIAAQNGGGAFLVPYFIALVTAGIPIMIIEYGLGIRSQGSANIAMGVIRRPFKYVGWMAILAAFFINIYYCVVMSWTWIHLIDALKINTWATGIADSKNHFFNNVLGLSKGPFDFGGIKLSLLAGLAATWFVIWMIIKGGLGRIGKVLLYTVPLPVVLVLILLIRGVTLDGSITGLNYYLSPQWEMLAQPKVWLAAYGQIFFSLSVGFAIMIAYSSFMPRKTEVPNTAAITSFANCSFSFLAGFAVFSVLGYFAVATNTPIDQVTGSGPGLAFVVYPTALAKLPFAVSVFAFLFFLTLLLLGIDSAFSLLEAVSAAVSDKFNFSRVKSTSIVVIISFVLGIPFVTNAGLYWLDIVDHFINNYLITMVGILECIAVGYFLGIRRFTAEINKYAEIRLGKIFGIMIWVVTPGILIVTFIRSLIDEFAKPYEGYPVSALVILGGGVLALTFIGSFVIGRLRTKNDLEWDRIEEQLLQNENGGKQ